LSNAKNTYPAAGSAAILPKTAYRAVSTRQVVAAAHIRRGGSFSCNRIFKSLTLMAYASYIGNGKAQPPVSVYPHIEFHGGQRRRLAGRAN
jgi:hypothetical protein